MTIGGLECCSHEVESKHRLYARVVHDSKQEPADREDARATSGEGRNWAADLECGRSWGIDEGGAKPMTHKLVEMITSGWVIPIRWQTASGGNSISTGC
jgi:hypothetical protein